ncbi:MAG: transposase [Thermomicrobiales bacterium]
MRRSTPTCSGPPTVAAGISGSSPRSPTGSMRSAQCWPAGWSTRSRGRARCCASTSGKYKSTHPRLSQAGNRHVRRIIWLLAVGAVRHPGPYRDYFDRRTAASKNKMDSLVAVGRKLLTTSYAILKSGHPSDSAYPGASADHGGCSPDAGRDCGQTGACTVNGLRPAGA